MAAPRVTITDLPDKPVAAPGDLLVIQDGAITKKMTMQHLVDGTGVADLRATVINTTLPLTGGGDLSVSRTLAINTFSATVRGAVPPPTTPDGTKFLRDDATWQVPPGGGSGGSGLTNGDKGDIVVGLLGEQLTFDSTVVTAAARTVLDDLTTTAMLATLGAQPADPDLTAIAGLAATTNNVIQSVGAAWASRTPAQLKTTLALSPSDVGLDQVSNTSPANMPVSNAQAAADALKADKSLPIATVAPLVGGGTLASPITLSINNFTAGTAGAVPSPGGASGRFLKDDGTWGVPAGGGGGSSLTIKEDTTTLGTAFTSLVFANGFDVTAAGTEATAVLDLSEYTGAALPSAKVAGLGPLATATAPISVAQGGTGVTTLTAATFLQGNGAAAVTATKAVPAGVVVGTTDTQTLIGKTIALGSNTVSGTLAQLNTAITDADVPAALNGLTGVWIGTQAQYTALGTYVSTVVYMVTA